MNARITLNERLPLNLSMERAAKVPLVIVGKQTVLHYGDALEKPQEYFYPVILCDGMSLSPNIPLGLANLTFEKKFFKNLKKPCLFNKKKEYKVTIFWVADRDGASKFSFLMDVVPGRDRAGKNGYYPTVELSAVAWANVCFTDADAVKMEKWFKDMSKRIAPGNVMLTRGELHELLKYDFSFNVGDCYKNKIITSRYYDFVEFHGNKLGQNVKLDLRLSQVFSDSSSNLLKKIGLLTSKDYLVFYSQTSHYKIKQPGEEDKF